MNARFRSERGSSLPLAAGSRAATAVMITACTD